MKLFSTFILVAILTSCATSKSVNTIHLIQKRKYTKGWHFNQVRNNNISSNDESNKQKSNLDGSINSINNLSIPKIQQINPTHYDNSECDTIILNDGKIVRVNILNTTPTIVRYTKCESEDTTELILAKEEIKALQYANGDFEFIKHSSNKTFTNNEISKEKVVQNKKEDDDKKALKITGIIILIIVIVLIIIFLIILKFLNLLFG